jgi:catechol 2,3-dioxygenase
LINVNSYQLPDQARVGFAHLRVSNLAHSLQYYRDLLGLAEIERAGQQVTLSPTGRPPAILILEELPGARPKPARTTGLYHTAIRLPDRAGLAQLLKRLMAHRWPLQGASDHGVSEALYLPDPDGLGVELYVDRPQEAWPRQEETIAMVTEPLDLENLLAQDPGEETPWQGISARTDIGHVHMHVADLKQAGDFYQTGLGFDLKQAYYGALFLAAGSYHHHIGLNIWAGAGAPAPPPDSVGLFAYGLELPDDAGLQDLITHLKKMGIAVTSEGSDRGQGGAQVLDPDGIIVELSAAPVRQHEDAI